MCYNSSMSEKKLDRILFLGMDLSGKSETAAYAGRVLGRTTYGNLLGADRTFYRSAVARMGSEVLTGEEQVRVFEEIYLNDLDNFQHQAAEHSLPAVQDNIGIVRVIAYNRHLGRNVCRLTEILESYPRPDLAIYLTCSKEERLRRLESRADQKKEDIYERLLRDDPKSFYDLDDYGLELSDETFGCEVIDTTDLSVEETLAHVLKKVKGDG